MGVNRVNADLGGPKRTAAIADFGARKPNGIDRVSPKTLAPKRSAVVALDGANSRSPAYPTAVNVGLGGGRKNGIGAISPAKTRRAFDQDAAGATGGAEKPGPMGGLPGKGGPNRSAGTPRVKGYVKSEGF